MFAIDSRRAGCVCFLVVIAGALGACTGKHVRMLNPDTTRGPRYTCNVGGTCNPATFEDEARLNPSGTKDVPLPRECGGKLEKLVVLGAASEAPRADVACAFNRRFRCSTGATKCNAPPPLTSTGDMEVAVGFNVPLPAQCQGRIHRVVILNIDSATAEIDVTCAPPEDPPDGGGLQDM